MRRTSAPQSRGRRPRLVLASGSPRRAELLQQVVADFIVRPADIDENRLEHEGETEYVLRICRSKAEAVFQAAPRGRGPGLWTLGADTIVAVAGSVLGKPQDAEQARWMLSRLQGRRHEVMTGVCLLDGRGEVRFLDAVVTAVWMRRLEDDEIEEYLRSGEPYDKAGGYAIQGLAGRFIQRIQGSFSNVVGLPLEEVRDILGRHGLLAT